MDFLCSSVKPTIQLGLFCNSTQVNCFHWHCHVHWRILIHFRWIFFGWKKMYVHGTYICKYKHVCTLYIRVHTCIYMYIHLLTCINMCTPCTNGYRHVCNLFVIFIPVCQRLCSSVLRWIHTFHQIYIHHSTVYVHRCKLLVSAFWFALLADLYVGTGWCQVSRLWEAI